MYLLSGLVSAVRNVALRLDRPAGTLIWYVFSWPIIRPTVRVISVWNDPPAAGISQRRATGTDAVAPFRAENCTDSGWSPG